MIVLNGSDHVIMIVLNGLGVLLCTQHCGASLSDLSATSYPPMRFSEWGGSKTWVWGLGTRPESDEVWGWDQTQMRSGYEGSNRLVWSLLWIILRCALGYELVLLRVIMGMYCNGEILLPSTTLLHCGVNAFMKYSTQRLYQSCIIPDHSIWLLAWLQDASVPHNVH